MEEKEVWEKVKGSRYNEVSNLGRVKSIEHKRWCVPNNSFSTIKEKIIIPSNNNSKKYWRIQIYYKECVRVTEAVHRLVAIAFVPNPHNKHQVNHKDLDKDNNRASNLEWVTNKENMRHAIENGALDGLRLSQLGEGSHFNKYPESLIRKIPILINAGNSYTKIALDLNIPITLITEIKAGRAWKHLNLHIPESDRSAKLKKWRDSVAK